MLGFLWSQILSDSGFFKIRSFCYLLNIYYVQTCVRFLTIKKVFRKMYIP